MSKTLEEIQELKAKEYGFNSFKDLEKSEHGSDPHWNVREDIAYTYVEELESQTHELIELLEHCKSVIHAYNDYKPTAIGNEILQAIQERLTKYNHLKSNTNG